MKPREFWMKPSERLDEIEDKWTHSRMDYTDSKWLIERVKTLTSALEKILPEWELDFESVSIEMGLDVHIQDVEVYKLARKALEGDE